MSSFKDLQHQIAMSHNCWLRVSYLEVIFGGCKIVQGINGQKHISLSTILIQLVLTENCNNVFNEKLSVEQPINSLQQTFKII